MKIGMLFPGYPSQFVGMGKELYDNSRTVQEYFEEASNCLGMNFVKLCFASSDADIAKVSHAFPSLFLVGASIAHMIREVCPTMELDGVAGHGVGEYAALYTASGITFPDGLYILNKFSQVYSPIQDELLVRTVIIKGMNDRKVKQLCDEHDVHVTVSESDRNLVTGTFEAIELFVESARQAGSGRIKDADTVEGYHTELLQHVMEHVTLYLTKVDFYDPEVTFISCLDGKQIKKAKKVHESLMGQMVSPLNWKSVLKQFADYDMLLVPGPSKMLVAELSSLFPDKIIMGIETMADIERLQAIIHEGEAETVVQTI